MSNYEVFGLSEVEIFYIKGNRIKESTESEVEERVESEESHKIEKKKCLLFDYQKRKVTPIIYVVKIFGMDEKEEDTFEFELDNELKSDGDGNITLERKVSAFDNFYIVKITAKKGEKLY